MDDEDEEENMEAEASSSRGRTVSASPAPSITRRSARSQVSVEPSLSRNGDQNVENDDDEELREVADDDMIMVKEEPMDPMPANASDVVNVPIAEDDEKD